MVVIAIVAGVKATAIMIIVAGGSSSNKHQVERGSSSECIRSGSTHNSGASGMALVNPKAVPV